LFGATIAHAEKPHFSRATHCILSESHRLLEIRVNDALAANDQVGATEKEASALQVIIIHSLDSDSMRIPPAQKKEREDTVVVQSRRRTYFLYGGGGFLEFAVLGFGHRISDSWSLAFKLNGVIHSGKRFMFPTAAGLGLKVSRFFSERQVLGELHMNVVNAEPALLIRTNIAGLPYIGLNGFSFEVTLGYENSNDTGLHFFWLIGGVFSSAKKVSPLYFPSLKLGLNWNF